MNADPDRPTSTFVFGNDLNGSGIDEVVQTVPASIGKTHPATRSCETEERRRASPAPRHSPKSIQNEGGPGCRGPVAGILRKELSTDLKYTTEVGFFTVRYELSAFIAGFGGSAILKCCD